MSTADAARRALGAAAARGLSGVAGLHFRGEVLHRDGRPLGTAAPHLRLKPGDGLAAWRGSADGLALRLRGCDAALHHALLPQGAVQRWVFELLEQLRVESLVPPGLPGVACNLQRRHEDWAQAVQGDGLADSASGLLLYTLAQMARAQVCALPVAEATEGLIEATRMALAPRIGHTLTALRRHRRDQAAYARHALALAQEIGCLLQEAVAGIDLSNTAAEPPDAAARALARLLALDGGGEDGGEAGAGTAATGGSAAGSGYRVFTTAYDSERRAASLVRAAVLREHRHRLDEAIAGARVQVARLARELQVLLARPQRDGWDDGQEAGRIDGRRLAQLACTPGERRLFCTEREQPQPDAVVTFLVDCSGSMRRHAPAIALLVDVLARALELAGVHSEVLGFTTGAWNGGRARRDWQRAGRPPRPGRLNECCHLVFKDADTPWRRARADIAALLHHELWRESIDGEAIEWACARLSLRPELHRVLVVVSDACPMDGATALANDADYLEQHMLEVVARQERQGVARLCGVGLGVDPGTVYRRGCVIDDGVPLGNAALYRVIGMLGALR